MEPIFLKPALQDKIWGGTALRDQFGFDIPSETTGEAWVISAHPNGESVITSPNAWDGKTLSDLYSEWPELFGSPHPDKFPLLVKILDAAKDLSVQVHPDDEYGLANEGELGKTECWYIISAEPDAEIVYGHNANTPEEFRAKVEAGQWDQLLRRISVKAGDFFYVPAGTIHAIGGGIQILETQQNSDTTYRVYDYDRLDEEGNLRDLHIEESIEVTGFPHEDPTPATNIVQQDGGSVTQFVSEDYFTVYKWSVDAGPLTLDLPKNYYLATVIKGEGTLQVGDREYNLKLSDSFILPTDIIHATLQGNLEILASNPEFPTE